MLAPHKKDNFNFSVQAIDFGWSILWDRITFAPLELAGMLTSTKNPRVKLIKSLEKSKQRREQQLAVIEGVIEIELAINAGIAIKTMVVCESLLSAEAAALLHKTAHLKCEILPVNDTVFNHLAYRDDAFGIIALAAIKQNDLASLRLPENPVLLVLDGVEKPGNLGALFRTADAAGVDAIIITELHTDLFNPNVIRASLGCVFSVPWAAGSLQEVGSFLKEKSVAIYTTHLFTDKWYHEVDYRQPTAIVMGTEATGVNEFWVENCTQLVKIPMAGRIDSMNVSASAAVVVFEVMRQRNFNL